MKKFWTWVLVAACSAVLAGPAMAAKPKKPKPTRAEIFKKLDKNSDGSLTFDEFKGKRKNAEKAKKAFARLDQDGDDKLTVAEFSAKPKKKKGK